MKWYLHIYCPVKPICVAQIIIMGHWDNIMGKLCYRELLKGQQQLSVFYCWWFSCCSFLAAIIVWTYQILFSVCLCTFVLLRKTDFINSWLRQQYQCFHFCTGFDRWLAVRVQFCKLGPFLLQLPLPMKTQRSRCLGDRPLSIKHLSHPPLCFFLHLPLCVSVCPSSSIKVANKSRLPYSWGHHMTNESTSERKNKTHSLSSFITYWSSFHLQLLSQSLQCSFSFQFSLPPFSPSFSLSCLSTARLYCGTK